MTDRVEVQITAKDNLSPILAKAGSAGTKMGDQLSRSGKTASAGLRDLGTSATTATAGLSKLDAASNKTDAGLTKMKVSGAAFGAAMTTVAGLLGDASRAAAEESVTFARLQAAVEATGKSYADYADQIDGAIAKGQDLSFADDQIADALGKLTVVTGDTGAALEQMGLVMDFARARNIDLGTAADIVGKVMGGNIGILGRYGIVLQDGATSTDALAAIQGKAAGQAEAYANTQQGAIDRIKNSFDNFMESVGANTGVLQTGLAVLPGVSAGYTILGGVVGKAAEGFKGLTPAMAAGGARLAVFGPALAGVGAAALIAAPAVALFAAAVRDYREGEEAAAQAANLAAARIQALGSEYDAAGAKVLKFIAAHKDQAIVAQDVGVQNTSLASSFDKVLGLTDRQIASLADLTDEENYTADSMQELANRIVAYAHANAEAQQSQLEMARGLTTITTAAQTATTAMTLHNAALENASQTALETARSGVVIESGIQARADAWNEEQARIKEAQQAMFDLANTMRGALGQATVDTERGIVQLDGSFETLSARLGIVADDVLDVLRVLQKAGDVSGGIGSALDIADDVSDTGAALDGIIARFETLDALGQRSASAGSIASNLIGDPGVWATVDDLLASGAISLEQYNAAVEAGTSIGQSNVAVQENLNAIRTAQLPILAQQEAAYATQIDRLAGMSAGEQAHALAMMDSGEQAKVAAAYSTAYAASLGEIPPTVATDLIANAAAADPVLAGVLKDLGLISVGADGTITVNLPDASEAAINKFQEAFGAGNVSVDAYGLIHVENGPGNELVYDQFGNLVDKTVTATVKVNYDDPGYEGDPGGFQSGPKAIEIPVKFTTDDQALQDLTTTLTDYTGKTYSASLTLDGAQLAESNIASLTTKLDGFNGANYGASLSLDGAPLITSNMANLNQRLTDYDGKTYTATVALNVPGVMPGFNDLVGTLQTYDGSTPTATLSLNGAPLITSNMANLNQRLTDYDGQAYSATLALDSGTAVTRWNDLSTQLNAFGGHTYTATLSLASGTAVTDFNTLATALNDYNRRTVTATLGLNIADAHANLTGMVGQAIGWDGATYTATLGGDNAGWANALQQALGGGGAWAAASFTALIGGDNAGWAASLAQALEGGGAWSGATLYLATRRRYRALGRRTRDSAGRWWRICGGHVHGGDRWR